MDALKTFWARFSTPGTQKAIWLGLENTAIIAVFGLVLGFVIGCILATIEILPSRNPLVRFAKAIAHAYVAVFRGTPMMVQLLLMHFAVFAAVKIVPVVEVSLIFGLNSGAYMSEILRGGINSVDKGQMEAGRTLGLSYTTTMFRVVLPQAFKNCVPTVGNEFISLLKETSIVSVVGLADLTRSFKAIADSTFEYFVPYIALAVIYFFLVMLVTVAIHLLERRLKRNERHA